MIHLTPDDEGKDRAPAYVRPDGATFRILRHLADEGCSTESDVTRAMGDKFASLTLAKALRELEQSGLIKRKYVAITPTGLAQLERTERRAARRKVIVDKAAELAALVIATTPAGPKAE